MSSSDQPPPVRPTATFHSSVWGDLFLNYNPQQDQENRDRQVKEQEILKEEVRQKLIDIVELSLTEKLNLIDVVQRLGLAYHFEPEIELLLQLIYTSLDQIQNNDNHDLYTSALCFRLLRQHAYRISSDMVFNKFKDDEGKFNERLTRDVLGMLSFYEAAQLAVHGEDLLDEAIDFTTAHLQSIASNSSNRSEAEQILHVLKWPVYKAVPRIETRRFISIYENDPSHDHVLLKLAKLDFNILQSLHKEELHELSKWWKDLNFIGRLPFARDRLVEGYFSMLGLYHEPGLHYSISRTILAKGVVLLTFIDDTYDAYATPVEISLFIDAINRWDMSCLDQLPEYMQIIYQATLEFYDDVEAELAKKGWSYRVRYGIEAMKEICRAYYKESTWLRDNRCPTYEEYMNVALVSVGYTFTIVEAYMSIIDPLVTQQAMDWTLSRPKLLKVSELMMRLVEDLKSHKFERQRGHIPSSVECYMKQFGTTLEETYDEFNKQINNSWKDVNEECLKLIHQLPKPLVNCILNFTRVTNIIYDGDDNFTRVGEKMQAHIASLLIDPIPM